MSDHLDNLSDRKLNELFAVEVAKLRINSGGILPEPIFEIVSHKPWVCAEELPFCTDANAVLPWLMKGRWSTRMSPPDGKRIRVFVHGDYPQSWGADADTFPRAAVIALLRAKRAAS